MTAGALRGQSTYATPYTFTTFAGCATGGIGSTDGTGAAARFDSPLGVAADLAGNVYVADSENHTVRKITTAGVVTTLAGLAGNPGAADGTGTAARFNTPRGVAVDSLGNVYVADSGNQTIRKISAAGVVTTFAGSAGISGSTDALGSAARFKSPFGLAVDAAGNVYVADELNHTIRKVTPVGLVTTLAGSAGNTGSADGLGGAARFFTPAAVAVDSAGNVFVADTINCTIRKITASGFVTTFAGLAMYGGAADGTGSAARFSYPAGVAVDGLGNVYVGDTRNQTIRKVTASGVVTTQAGAAGLIGGADGNAAAARFNTPSGLALDATGHIFIADNQNHTIRALTTATGNVTTFAGSATSSGDSDGPGSSARFKSPQSVAVDGSGNVYVADSDNYTIRKITPAGVVTTFAGLSGNPGFTDGTGSSARLLWPHGVAVDGSGNVYVADMGYQIIRKITPAAVVTTFAGTPGIPGSTDGTGSAARFTNPRGVAADVAGNVYVADTQNLTIRKITPSGVVTTLAGLAGSFGAADGTGSAARFAFPLGVATDAVGNVYVADTGNHTIRKISSGGVVTTLAGVAGVSGFADGTGGAARFDQPSGLAADAAGNLYVTDSGNATIRKVTPAGVVTTLAGEAGIEGSSDGAGSTAHFAYFFNGIAVGASGTLYVADSVNQTIRKGLALVPVDFNSDQHPDILWQNLLNGTRGFWRMDGTGALGWVDIGTVATAWRIAATADFNGDGKPDILWENTVNGDRGVWLMNGATVSSWVDLGILSTDWHIAAAADFNGDGKPDILWENSVTGDRGIWLLDGTTFISWVEIGVLPTALKIVGAADFNGDGKNDIVWENTITGKRVIWFMNGTTFSSSFSLGVVSTDWHIAALANYDLDGKIDILWENTVTGDRGFWLMNGTTLSSWVDLGVVGTDWRIAN